MLGVCYGLRRWLLNADGHRVGAAAFVAVDDDVVVAGLGEGAGPGAGGRYRAARRAGG